MAEPKRVGRRVFPNDDSPQIRQNQQYHHYRRAPPDEPPIDYTIRVQSEKDYKVVQDVFHRPSSVDFSKEESHLSSTSTPRLGGRVRRDTVEEILDELDTVLFEASIPFDELKKKVQDFNLTFKPYAPGSEKDLPEIPYSPEPKRIPKLDPIPTKRDVLDEKLQAQLNEMYLKTIEKIEAAKKHFSAGYFREQYQREGIPQWKRNLLADKKSKETIQRIEHDAWLDYERFKAKVRPTEKIKRSSSVQLGGPRRKQYE